MVEPERQGAIFGTADAEQYDRHVGRYNAELARALIELAGVRPAQTALDVGCGPGALTRELATLVGQDHVSAVDPSPSFVAAAQKRLPGVDVREAAAEQLPFADGSFDHALAQLVVNFMKDARAGVGEMVRVTRPGGRVSAATWDYADGMMLLRKFFDAAYSVDPNAQAHDEGVTMRYCSPDDLVALFEGVGLRRVEVTSAVPRATYADFADLWRPFDAGIGPSGVYLRSLEPAQQVALREEYRRLLGVGDAPFELSARAWLASGQVA